MIRFNALTLVFAAGMLAGSLTVMPASALTGCCKMRDSIDGPWLQNNARLDACEKLNHEKDGANEEGRDAVYEERGFVWWDTECRQ